MSLGPQGTDKYVDIGNMSHACGVWYGRGLAHTLQKGDGHRVLFQNVNDPYANDKSHLARMDAARQSVDDRKRMHRRPGSSSSAAGVLTRPSSSSSIRSRPRTSEEVSAALEAALAVPRSSSAPCLSSNGRSRGGNVGRHAGGNGHRSKGCGTAMGIAANHAEKPWTHVVGYAGHVPGFHTENAGVGKTFGGATTAAAWTRRPVPKLLPSTL